MLKLIHCTASHQILVTNWSHRKSARQVHEGVCITPGRCSFTPPSIGHLRLCGCPCLSKAFKYQGCCIQQHDIGEPLIEAEKSHGQTPKHCTHELSSILYGNTQCQKKRRTNTFVDAGAKLKIPRPSDLYVGVCGLAVILHSALIILVMSPRIIQ